MKTKLGYENLIKNTKLPKGISKTFYGIPIKEDPSIPEGTIYFANTNWYLNETYSTIIKCNNRLKTAWRALTKGEVEIKWTVPSNKKDKSFRLKGKKEKLFYEN